MLARIGVLVAIAVAPGLSLVVGGAATPTATTEPLPQGDGACLQCHAGIEDIHPGWQLSCVDCHGGDATATTKERAHVAPLLPVANDERVLPRDWDLPYQRFLNPSNLRVAGEVCAPCHQQAVADLEKSLHGTTAGHLGDGYYEHGVVKTKTPTFSVFPIRDEDGDVGPHAIRATQQIPPFHAAAARRGDIGAHFTDLPRKACMHCHLYSEGRAVDGRLGLDGDYRGEGCAACHVTYADDGRSRSRDLSIDKVEPGHPIAHRFTSRIPTETCTRCHYGDASIGLHFRGLAQLVPGMPAGPDVPGTTDSLLNGVFYIRDEHLTPPDVHHEQGMHCIDCHTLADTMGDGDIYPQMDHAVEIECTSCHGTFDVVSDLTTSKGRRVPNLERKGDDVYLTSKVTGRRHLVTQVKHVLDPTHSDYNADAAAAMTSQHARLECYTCHNGWNVTFYGFHFDRNEQFTQLDLLSGVRTPGRVTTQEKVFATFNQLRLGFNHEGMIAPYTVGFSTIGSAHDERGEPILQQAAPVTAAGLSGVTLVPHQMHTTRPEARDCADCHRSSSVYGMGSPNFRLTREIGFAIDPARLLIVALDTRTPTNTEVVARLELGDGLRAVAVSMDEVLGRSKHVFVANARGEIIVVDVANPVMPRQVARKRLLVDPRRIHASGDHLWVADGVGGVAILDVSRPRVPKLLQVIPTIDAQALALQWPWLLVADGPGGLLVFDVHDSPPRLLSTVDLNYESAEVNEAFDVAVLFQASRTFAARGGGIGRTRPRNLAVVACGLDGVRLVDITDPESPEVLHETQQPRSFRFDRGDVRSVAVNTVFELGTAGGGVRSAERDYAYLMLTQGADGNRRQIVRAVDITDPQRPLTHRGAEARLEGQRGVLLRMIRAYNAPFLQHFVVAAGAGGLGTLIDVSRVLSSGAEGVATWEGAGVRDLVVEELAFDRLQDESGNQIKDISHADCRYLTPAEIARVIGVPLQEAATPRRRRR